MSKSFSEFTSTEENNIMIVDSLNLAFRWRNGQSHKLFDAYLDTIDSLKRSYKAKYVIVLADKGGSDYRKSISPEYKQNRTVLQDKQTEEEQEEFLFFFSEYKRALEQVREESSYPVLQYQGVEADDIAAYLVSKLRKDYKQIWLISTDKDWDLLISPTVSRFSYVTRKETRVDNWSDIHNGYTLEDFISIKCLTGDTGDNVAGIKGVGPKTACNLIQTYGTAMDLAEALPIESHLKVFKEINASRDLIYLNYQLMDLVCFCREAIGQKNINEIDAAISEYLQ